MYFEDRSPGNELGYLADGLTEALIDELSVVDQLRVTSRNGSAAFKGKVAPSDSVARVLKVGTVVNGTVEPAGDGKVRVVVRLDDGFTGDQIDRQQIVHSIGNSLALQDSIAQKVSVFLRERVGEEIQALRSRIGTRNDAAWEAMQRARQTLSQVNALIAARDIPAALAKVPAADSALARVEALDGNWVTPIIERAWISYWTALRLVTPRSSDHPKWIERGLAHAERALQKAPNDPNAIEARGTLHYLQWLTNLAPNPSAAAQLMASAEKDLRTATDANSRAASAWNTLSHLLINQGKLSEAKLAAETAYNADPFLMNVELTIHRAFLASLDLGLRDEAEKWCAHGQSRFPENYRFIQCKLWLFTLPEPGGRLPDMNEVRKVYDAYVAASPANVQAFDKLKGRMMMGIAFVRAGQLDSAKTIAETEQGDPSIDPRAELAYLAAIIYGQTGEPDRAIAALRRNVAANPHQRAFAGNDESWWLRELRKDPKYQAFVKTLN